MALIYINQKTFAPCFSQSPNPLLNTSVPSRMQRYNYPCLYWGNLKVDNADVKSQSLYIRLK